MGVAYEFDGQIFGSSGEFLDAVAHEYKNGDKDLAVQSLEDYGFSVSDINTGPQHPHPISVSDDATADISEDSEEE